MEECKKIIAGFGLRPGQAVIKSGNQECLVEDYITLGRFYSDNGADQLFIQDLSETDGEHETVIGMIKELNRVTDTPILAGGRIRRLEDVKKYLYAGAKAVYLEASEAAQEALLEEGAKRFGSDKIYMLLPGEEWIGRAVEFQQRGASHMILKTDGLAIEALETVAAQAVPYLFLCDAQENTMACLLKVANSCGVVVRIPAEKDETPMEIKHRMKTYDISVDTFESAVEWKDFKRDASGLIPVVVQDYRTLEVLMVAYMNEEAFQATVRSGKMTYYSRSRRCLWLKGETSGHYQYVKSLHLDCDNDTLLAKVAQVGAACHTGARSCFYQTLVSREVKEANPLKVFEEVYQVILDRKIHPKEGSYTNYLFDKGIDKILKKVGEEATEIVIAAKNPNPEEVKYEISDLLYHLMVLMAEKGLGWEEITEELANR